MFPLPSFNSTAPRRVPAKAGVNLTSTVQDCPELYVVLPAQVPVPASAKSSPETPVVSTAVEPRVTDPLKLKIVLMVGLEVPMLTDPKLPPGNTSSTTLLFTSLAYTLPAWSNATPQGLLTLPSDTIA